MLFIREISEPHRVSIGSLTLKFLCNSLCNWSSGFSD